MDVIEAKNGWEIDCLIEQAMDALRCPPPDEPVVHLSGGERRRVALCKLLLEAPDLLLLDEPTNHLDAESVEWLEKHLARYPGAVLAVTHDRYFLDNVAEWILELDRGRAYPYEGNYSTYLEKKQQRLEVQGKKDAKLVQAPQGRARVGPAERQGPADQEQEPPRPLRGDGRRGGEDAQARLRGDPDPAPARGWARSSSRPRASPRASATGSSSTTCRSPCRAAASSGSSARTASARRRCSRRSSASSRPTPARSASARRSSWPTSTRAAPNLDPAKTVWETVSDGLDYIKVGQQEMPSRAYIGAFGFKGPDQQKPAGVLSGGERNRLNLALTLKEGGNVLLLDEPTNDLDVETLGSPGERAAGVPGLRRGHHPRPVVPRPGRDAHPGLGGRRGRTRRAGTGSRATSSPTRRTRSNGWARRPRVRTA